MDNWILFLALIFFLVAFISRGAVWKPSSVPSLSEREKRHLRKLRSELNTVLSDDDFFRLALRLWDVVGIKPLNLRRSSNFMTDFNISPQDISTSIGKIEREFGTDTISQNADRVSTLHDLVKVLEVTNLTREVEPPKRKVERPVCAEKGCPKCGFTYKWDGQSCNHCGYSR